MTRVLELGFKCPKLDDEASKRLKRAYPKWKFVMPPEAEQAKGFVWGLTTPIPDGADARWHVTRIIGLVQPPRDTMFGWSLFTQGEA